MKERHKDLPWHSREVIPHKYPLTDSEKLKLAEQMADARAEIVRLESDLSGIKKSYKEEIDMRAGELSQAATQFKSGLADAVDVECDIYQDFKNQEMVYVAVETGEELKRRPMMEKEKMPTLFSLPDVEIEQARISRFPK